MTNMEEMQYQPTTKYPVKNRSCTDVVCFLLFLAFLAGWLAVAVVAVSKGNPVTLIYPSNSSGIVCGRGPNENATNLLFHDITKCISVFGCPTSQVCVKKCPKETTSLRVLCKLPELDVCQVALEKNRKFCVPMTDDEWNNAKKNPTQLMDDRKCPSYTLESFPVLGRCVPDFGILDKYQNKDDEIKDDEGNSIQTGGDEDPKIEVGDVIKAIKYMTDLLNAGEIAEKVWADLIKSWYWILGGQGLSLVVAFFWIFLMRFITGPMIYISMLLSIGLLGVSAAYSWVKYSSFAQTEQQEHDIFGVNPITDGLSTYLEIRDTWLAFFIISVTVTVILLLILIFLRTRIAIAVELIKESSKAIYNITSSLFFPIVPFFLQLIVVCYFCVVAAFLASTGEQEFNVAHASDAEQCQGLKDGDECNPETFSVDENCPAECIFRKMSVPDEMNYLQLYNLLGLFWGLFFASALGEMVLAGGFSSWYWALDKNRDVPSFTLFASFYRTIRYHLGTLAFGSLIVAIIRLIRVALQYIENKIKEKGIDNVFSKIFLFICKCCFWCLEKFIKFLNRNAYIITASVGTNFCTSAKEAFGLIIRNVARVAVLDKVTDFILFLGKLVVVGCVAVLSYYTFSGKLDSSLPLEVEAPKLNYYFIPVIIIIFSAYMIATCFFSVFSMAVDTVFLCFLLDLEQNANNPHPQYFMSKNLMKILKLKQAESKKKGDAKK